MAENSTDDNSNLVDMDDLNAFEDAFYDRKPEEAEVEKEVVEDEEVDETGEDSPATEEAPEAEAEEEEEAEAEPEPEAKGKKKSALQTRIDELVAEAREAQRERDALKAKLDAIDKAREEKVPEKEVPLRDQLPPEAPNPDAVDDKGEPVYQLGEFDPKYIRDLTRFTIEQETKAAKEREAEEAKQQEAAKARVDLQVEWAEKVKAAEEDLPDFKEKVTGLTEAFKGIDEQYGDYLATTIMQCDNGPEIMYYLSQNIGEARDIVASGPFAATLAIGRLQAKLEKPVVQEEPSNTKKASEAPNPPPVRTRGSGGKFSVSPDTNDLDAFEREFFQPQRRR